MKYVIRGLNLKVTRALNDFIEKKLKRLEKYFETAPSTEASVVLSVVKEEHKVEVTIPLPGLLVRAEESSEDMYASIDMVVEKLERQVRKHKTKVNRKLRQEGSIRLPQLKDTTQKLMKKSATAVLDEEEEQFQVVRTKRFNLKPMDTEEAILQMNMIGHNFFVFSNDKTDQVCIIYRRKDGKYGLIEPE